MRRGGPQDQPGGWSSKTYVLAQKLRAAAELCLSLAQVAQVQVAGLERIDQEFFGKNFTREFFQASVSAASEGADWVVERRARKSSVLGKLIRESCGGPGAFATAEDAK